jgi:CHAT domain-containing protein
MPFTADLIERLSNATGDLRSVKLMEQNPELREADVVLGIADHVNRIAREDLGRAEQFADMAVWLAELVGDDFCRGRAARSAGNTKVLRGNYQAALEDFNFALSMFEKLGVPSEQAATLASTLQPLMYLGKYPEAFERATRARQIAIDSGDKLLLARISINFANILHRQDRFSEAVKYYETALQILAGLGQLRDCAIASLNLAVCYISLNDFSRAQRAYEDARIISEKEKMPRVAAQADYNIAYLYYYRGEYAQAIELYRKTRAYCEEVQDEYHRALCDLDQAEMYLELRLHEETAQLGEQAKAAFEQMNMLYEAAKATVWLGLAAYQSRRTFRAFELFAAAQEQMRGEGNMTWVAVLTLFQALLLEQEGRYFEALRTCKKAQTLFESLPVGPKTIHTILVRARLHLQLGQAMEAHDWMQAARLKAQQFQSPYLLSQAHKLLGRFAEGTGAYDDAKMEFRRSIEYLDKVPVQTSAESLKIPHSRNESDVYEALLSLEVSDTKGVNADSLFDLIEGNKSRKIAELVSFRASAIPPATRNRSALVEQLKSLREELSWYYHQAESSDLNPKQDSGSKAAELRELIGVRESALLKTLDSMRHTDEEFHSIQTGSTISIERVREGLFADEILVEFFEARGVIYAFLLTRNSSRVVPLNRAFLVRGQLRRLHAQFLNLQSGIEWSSRNIESQTSHTVLLLSGLYHDLIAPIREFLEERRIIFVPDGPLAYVPFVALFDGKRFLTEDFTMSYAGSASGFSLNSIKPKVASGIDVIVGAGAGHDSCTMERFRQAPNLDAFQSIGVQPRFLQLCCELRIREDNSFLSTIRIGDKEKTVLDLFTSDLSSSVATLVGGGPGIRASGGGMEIQGLVRAVEYSGARSVLLPLWNLEGNHTKIFLDAFYRGASVNSDRAAVFQSAVAEVRRAHPHPFYWAGFTLHGQTGRTIE